MIFKKTKNNLLFAALAALPLLFASTEGMQKYSSFKGNQKHKKYSSFPKGQKLERPTRVKITKRVIEREPDNFEEESSDSDNDSTQNENTSEKIIEQESENSSDYNSKENLGNSDDSTPNSNLYQNYEPFDMDKFSREQYVTSCKQDGLNDDQIACLDQLRTKYGRDYKSELVDFSKTSDDPELFTMLVKLSKTSEFIGNDFSLNDIIRFSTILSKSGRKKYLNELAKSIRLLVTALDEYRNPTLIEVEMIRQMAEDNFSNFSDQERILILEKYAELSERYQLPCRRFSDAFILLQKNCNNMKISEVLKLFDTLTSISDDIHTRSSTTYTFIKLTKEMRLTKDLAISILSGIKDIEEQRNVYISFQDYEQVLELNKSSQSVSQTDITEALKQTDYLAELANKHELSLNTLLKNYIELSAITKKQKVHSAHDLFSIVLYKLDQLASVAQEEGVAINTLITAYKLTQNRKIKTIVSIIDNNTPPVQDNSTQLQFPPDIIALAELHPQQEQQILTVYTNFSKNHPDVPHSEVVSALKTLLGKGCIISEHNLELYIGLKKIVPKTSWVISIIKILNKNGINTTPTAYLGAYMHVEKTGDQKIDHTNALNFLIQENEKGV